LQDLANAAASTNVADLSAFAHQYINIFSTGYNYAFGIAALAMLISLSIYMMFKNFLPDRKAQMAAGDKNLVQMPKKEEKQRIIALLLVFFVVIFFWMSFHQNGLTLTFFARDYTMKAVGALSFIYFNLWSFISLIAAIFGLFFLIRRKSGASARGIGALLLVAGAVVTYLFYISYLPTNPIQPEIFQQFNPIFIVVLTPVIVGFFAMLRKRDKEPSTPRKIGIGMILAALGFLILIFGSLNLLSPAALAGSPSPDRVSPNWLISSYFIMTIAELFLSPMGLSFVSKVAPPRFQGLMQGGWLGATAIGNQFLFVGSSMWVKVEIWQVWAVFVVCCLISAAFIFSIMKRLEKVTG